MKIWMLTILAYLAIVTTAAAQKFPGYGGLVQSPNGMTSISWQCTPPGSDGRLSCRWSETAISRAAPKTVDKEAEELLAPGAMAECAEIEQMRDDLARKAREAMAAGRMDQDQSDTMGNFMTAMTRVCAERTKEAVADFVRLQNERAARTCSINSFVHDETFTWNGGSSRWENVEGPTGGCGQINISAFEPAGEYFWNLRRQSVITNRSGTQPLGESCATAAEKNDVYEWRTREVHPRCEFLSFGQ